MTTIRVAGQATGGADWLHRFRNFGEEVYVELRDICAVNIDEIDAAIDSFEIREVHARDRARIVRKLTEILNEHHLDDSVAIYISGGR